MSKSDYPPHALDPFFDAVMAGLAKFVDDYMDSLAAWTALTNPAP